MTYFTENSLHIRIKNSGLQPLYELLKGVAEGTKTWPQTCYIAVADSRAAGPLRNLIYSMLAHLAVKQEFTVKLIGDQIIINQKTGGASASELGIRFGNSYIGRPPATFHPHSDPGDTLDENIQDLFLDEPVQTVPDQPAPLQYSLDDRDDPDPVVQQFLQTVDMGKNSPIFKSFNRHRLIFEDEAAYEPDRIAAKGKMEQERRNMEKAIRAIGLINKPLTEEAD